MFISLLKELEKDREPKAINISSLRDYSNKLLRLQTPDFYSSSPLAHRR
jgi:hypothetical protein